MNNESPQRPSNQSLDYSVRRDVRTRQAPLPNYSLASVCPACDTPTIRRACKVRCERCGFMWDCSEL